MIADESARVLSSGMTVFYKFVFSTIWTGGFAAGTLGLFLHPSAPHSQATTPPLEMRWLFLGLTVMGGLFLFWTCGRLKRIAISEDTIVVSNYLRTIRVPLVNVKQVSASRLILPETVWVVFSEPTSFGKSVIFMPPLRLSLGLTEHPMAAELRRDIEEARKRAIGARAQQGV